MFYLQTTNTTKSKPKDCLANVKQPTRHKQFWFNRLRFTPSFFLTFFISLSLIAPFIMAQGPSNLETDAQAGNPEAQFQLARALLKGEGLPKNTARALELMTLAANKGHAEAMGGLGYFYEKGLEVPEDQATAMEWFRKGAEAGGPKAQLNYGKLLIKSEKNEDIQQGMKWLQAAVDQKQPDAAHFLGTIYFLGQYDQKIDYQRALDCLIISAEAGNADSQNTLGVIYSQTYLGQKNEREAEPWFRKAASCGHVKAMSNLGGLLWKKPNADSQTRVEALKWLLIAQTKGEVTAEKTLADLSMAIDATELEDAKRLASQPQGDSLKQ